MSRLLVSQLKSGQLRLCSQRMIHASRKLQENDVSSSTTSGSTAPLPEYADVVVVGGGAVGAGIAYHLAKTSHPLPASAPPSVVLLEKTELTSGSTWHAAGLTTTYHFGLNMRKVHYDSVQLYSQLEKETGQAVGLHRCGSIRLAETPERMDEFRLQLSRAAWYTAPARMMEVGEVKEFCPLVNTDGLLGGLYNPHDGHVDPYSVTMAMGAGARMYGAKIFTNTDVSDFESMPGEDSRWKVCTSRGTILCRHVVNAAGFWGREVDALIRRRKGFEWQLPLVPVHHQYCVTDSVPEVAGLKKEIPVMRDLDGSYYFRMERDGLLVGPYEAMERMKLQESWLLDKVTPGFGRELYDSDVERIAPYLEKAVHRFPVFGNAPITRIVAGPITYAPDGLPMVGPKPGYPGMWLAVGFGYGIIHAGGIGRYLAQWIRSGYPPYDLTECDPGRYGSWSDDPRYILEKTRETYGMNNAYGYVKEERQAGRPSKRAGHFYSVLEERGAQFGFKAGFEVPLWFYCPGDEDGYRPSFHRTNWFEPVGRESKLVREHVGVIDLSSFAMFNVRGAEADAFLSLVFANKIPKVKGKSCLAHMLTPNGRVMAEMTVTCLEASDGHGVEFMLTTGGGSELHDLRWLEHHAADFPSVSIENTTEKLGCLGVAGPNSAHLLERVFPEDDFAGKTWPLLSHRKLTPAKGSHPVDVIRISYSGELGWEIHCPQEDLPGLYALLQTMGADLGVGDFGMYAMNSLRMEKGFRAWGAELSKDNTIVEAGMMAFVRDPEKTSPFIGASAVREELQMGSKEQLVMLQVLDDNGRTDPDGAEAVYCNGKVVGHVSSGCYGYQIGSGLAFAYITPYLAEEGIELEIDVIGQRRRCKVISPPVPAYHLRK